MIINLSSVSEKEGGVNLKEYKRFSTSILL